MRPRMWSRSPALVGVLATACAADDADARADWLRHTLVLDNQVFYDRVPDLAEGKIAKMGDRLYDYFRGTAPQYARDLTTVGGPVDAPLSYESAATRDVALVGDPHPENIGTYLDADGRLVVDFNDFDASIYGPYSLDVRRLALGWWVAGREIAIAAGDTAEPLGDDALEAAATACALAYAEDIARVAQDPGAGIEIVEGQSWGRILDDLFEGALADGFEQEKLVEYTTIEGGQRRMVEGEVTPARIVTIGGWDVLVFDDSVRPVGAREDALMRSLVEAWRDTVLDPSLVTADATRVKGISRRLGAGVSSYAHIRDYVLLEGATDGLFDDVLLEVKQVFDPLPLGGLPRRPDAPFSHNGERIVVFHRELQTTPHDDRWLGWAAAGDDEYRIRERTGYQRGLDVARIGGDLVAGDVSADDFVELARVSGRLLARAHGRARKQDGAPGAPAIASAIGGDVDGFTGEVVAFVLQYGPIVVLDHQRLRDSIAEHGPRLGYRAR